MTLYETLISTIKPDPPSFCPPFASFCTTGLLGTKHRKQDLKLTEVVDLVLFPLYPLRVHSTVVLNKHLLKLNETDVKPQLKSYCCL